MTHMQHFTDAGRIQAEKLVQQINDAGGEAKIDVTWKDYGADILWECVLAKSKNLDMWYFYGIPVTYNGLTFGSNEAAFQAQKCPERAHEFVDIHPGHSKKLGRSVQIRPDWDAVKDQVMYDLNLMKFRDNPSAKQKLLATGDREIIEENYWNDTYWGVCRGVGENRLGKILMKIRDELR